MQQNAVSSSYATAELQAREHRSSHEFREAANAAHAAAEIAGAEGDSSSWWHMTLFRAESLLEAGDFEACAEVARALVARPGDASPQLQVQAHILLAKTSQGLGQLEEAADAARAAADSISDEEDVEIAVKARQALIAALADSGSVDEAWAESLSMAEVISGEVDDQLVGKAYWVIGNVAFLCNKVAEGLHYHELAAATFSPARNLTVWAKFNKASAAMRLAADVADADTLRCIERAELATDVVGGSPNDFLLLKLNRGHWNYLAGEPAAAVELLEQVCADLETPSPQILGEACLLLGRSHAALGHRVEARKHLLEAADHFEKAGAPQRAEQALEFLSDVP
jgi:tetratricopeptide (TPR) repeat protein